MPRTRYVLQGRGNYDVHIQDASDLTTGRASIQKRPPQRR